MRGGHRPSYSVPSSRSGFMNFSRPSPLIRRPNPRQSTHHPHHRPHIRSTRGPIRKTRHRRNLKRPGPSIACEIHDRPRQFAPGKRRIARGRPGRGQRIQPRRVDRVPDFSRLPVGQPTHHWRQGRAGVSFSDGRPQRPVRVQDIPRWLQIRIVQRRPRQGHAQREVRRHRRRHRRVNPGRPRAPSQEGRHEQNHRR
jgi:hypothetical protein